MVPKLRNWFYFSIFFILLSAHSDARKSRIGASTPATDLKDAAAALPLNDNLATASGSDKAEVKVPPPSSQPVPEATTAASAPAVPASASAAALSSDVSSSGEELSSMEECEPDNIGYEIVTGYVFSSPATLMDSIPGTLMLTDCLEACSFNNTCSSINYETGLCVLFSSNADKLPGALTKSQFPVFTIYAQKQCFTMRPCDRPWCADRSLGNHLKGYMKRSSKATSRHDCFEMCLGETDFLCRSANYYPDGTCELSDMDRVTLAGTNAFQPAENVDYLENNCAEEPRKLCEFKRIDGKILKTVDSVYQDVGSVDECRDLCLNSPYKCRSYDYGDTGDMVCRLSHHSRATLLDVSEPYLEVPEAATYELSACYNVTIECRPTEMVTRFKTSRLFNGKVYAKGSPNSCALNIENSLDFALHMGYNDLECNVRQTTQGIYLNDVVIQHHKTIVTSADLGLAVTCQFDLTNIIVSNDHDMSVQGDLEPALYEDVVVDSPNVVMKITSRDGNELMRSASVGDALALRFQIMDPNSPYEIFVRELVAMDGADNGEIVLIDSRGCPTDQFIMGPIYKSKNSTKVLVSHFDAFKFPSSEQVQFRALVTPCMPSCEPVQCDMDEMTGGLRSIISFGRRRRSVDNPVVTEIRGRRETKRNIHEDMLLVQSIQITDKFGFEKQQDSKGGASNAPETTFLAGDDGGNCVNGLGLIVAGAIFLLAQLAVIAVWTFVWQQRRKRKHLDDGASLSVASSQIISTSSSAAGSPTDSMCKLYDNSYMGRQF